MAKFLTGPGSYSRILALLIVLANYKNFPGVWHIRVWYAILYHMIFQPPFTPSRAGLHDASHLPAVFQPTITPSRAPVTECDYNLHKSNSTYFTDLDSTRSHLVCALLHTAIEKLQKNPGQVIGPDGKPAKGRWAIMLGGVHCSFKREIKPYERYEMWTRVLCWDRKWFYVVTHFVKAGTVRPDGWTLDDPADKSFLPKFLRRAKRAKSDRSQKTGTTDAAPQVPANAIFASAISKYVMKLGRLTIHPEVALNISGLLPPRPGGWNIMDKPPATAEEKAEDEIEDEGLETLMEESILTTLGIPNGSANGSVSGGATSPTPATGSSTPATASAPASASTTGWDWKMIEAENARGMEYATHHHALDSLHETFTGSKERALGYYTDLF